jgi:Immunoglobulin I-set domain/PKD domain
MLFVFNAPASVLYVDLNCTNSTPPYADWSTAATNIQDAIDVSMDGDQILVTNGIYQAGGRVMAGDLTNRVALNKAITVQSVKGPWVTTILGAGATNGTMAVRCAWLTNGAALVGFTLSGGATRITGDTTTLQYGGGVWCVSSNAFVGNCLIVSNTANQSGGGAYQGMVSRSLISGNKTAVSSGGATYKSVLNNCTIVSNSTFGAASPFAMTNCIIYYNGASGNYFLGGSANSHCCTTPALTGTGNFTTAPQLFADGIHLFTNSPCIGAGINPVTGTDVFGNVWSNPPAVGCAEWQSAPIVTVPQIKLTSDPVGFTIGNLAVGGLSPYSFAWLKDGSPVQDNGHFSSTQTTSLIATGVSFADAGNYQVVVSNAFGVVTSSVVPLVIHCVNVAGSNPIAPYSNWATAATNIQDAITASTAGDVVLVTNGLYATGGKSMDSVITNRIAVDKAILVQSVNGQNATIIQGAWDPTSINGLGAVRCAWMTNNAILNGFTLRSGATRTVTSSPNQSMGGGGVLGTSTNAAVCHCILATNFASNLGGGAYSVTLNNCTLMGNHAHGSGTAGAGAANAGSGGGASNSNLKNCLITSNFADQSNGGGAQNCNLINCAITSNSSALYGSGANQGTLVNCTVTGNRNTSTIYSSYSGGVAFAFLSNCIVYGNFNPGSGPINYNVNCIFNYSDTDPLSSGVGNVDVDPQLLADGVHVAATSPCIGAGTASVVSSTDIDGQPWKNPPSMGCDEWQPAPVISAPLVYQVNTPAHGLTFNVIAGGQLPFTFFWNKDGAPIQDDGHHSNSGTANLVVNYFGPGDAGFYQVVVSNAFGVVTGQVAQVVIHAVDVAGINSIAPYSGWATAATNIQDAINIASAGDIVLVTNGVYSVGGKAIIDGDLTNRIAVDKAITVMSVNGYAVTAIQGAWDPISTNGPGAVRCAYLADGAVLNGFTLQNGATRASTGFIGNPPESGGGVLCSSANGVVANCVLSNNSAIYGGGISYGTLNNSLVLNNVAAYGGGAYSSTLNNCTVENNFATTSLHGAGTYIGFTRNSIVVDNYDNWPVPYSAVDNYSIISGPVYYSYSCTQPTSQLSGTGNINLDPRFLDLFHIASTSPCRGAGDALYASGTDFDGESWTNPPSMGCDEVIVSNLVGPLSVNIQMYQTNVLVNRSVFFTGFTTGHVSRVEWSFGDGPTITNYGAGIFHQWTNSGDYTVTFTAFNNDNPAGISTNAIIHVQPLNMPQLQSAMLLTNGFQFQFVGQLAAQYTFQYATNLVPPVAWQTLQTIYYSSDGVVQITDYTAPKGTRFYRVKAQ